MVFPLLLGGGDDTGWYRVIVALVLDDVTSGEKHGAGCGVVIAKERLTQVNVWQF